LLQIAHILLLLLEHGKFLRQRAAEYGKTPVQWFGSLKNIGQFLLESIRNWLWPEEQPVSLTATTAVPVMDSS